MTTKQKVEALAKELGATIQVINTGNTHDHLKEIQVESKPGYRWNDGYIHVLAVSEPGHMRMESLWREMLNRMQDGLTDCDDEWCEWCHETESL